MNCVMCGAEIDTAYYIFTECHMIQSLAFASKRGYKLEQWRISNIEVPVDFCINPYQQACFRNMDKVLITMFLITLLYCCWNFINEKVF